MADIVEEQKGEALWVTLNRPDCGNLITMEMIATLAGTLRSLPASVKLVVLRASGADFCKGRDYAAAPEDAKQGRKPSALQVHERMTTPIIDFYAAIKEVPVPTLSVVQGAAVGFGCAMACACDLVLAGERARFSLPEMHERGLPPSLAMTALLDRVSQRMLTYLVFSTEEVDARTAHAGGLVSAVVAHDRLDSAAAKLAEHVCSQPADSIRAVKSYLKLAPAMEPRGRAALGSGLFAIVAGSR